MGPRSHERGNGRGRQPMVLAGRCFNGAAFSRTRKLWRRSGWARASRCFNGAAFSRTRKLVKETILSYDETLLQWGRVLTNAETPPPRRQRFLQGAYASMGPRSHERGNRPGSSVGCRRRGCFNGAAFSRTRKQSIAITVGSTVHVLQWGRVLTNAETSRLDDGPDAVTHASMGPRSHERGNLLDDFPVLG